MHASKNHNISKTKQDIEKLKTPLRVVWECCSDAFKIVSMIFRRRGALNMKFVSVHECNFYFNFGRTTGNFTLELCYNLVDFRNMYRGGTFKSGILLSKQSINLIFACFYN